MFILTRKELDKYRFVPPPYHTSILFSTNEKSAHRHYGDERCSQLRSDNSEHLPALFFLILLPAGYHQLPFPAASIIQQ